LIALNKHKFLAVIQINGVNPFIYIGLPGHCSFFDMVEDARETGSFLIPDIERNRSDIYKV